MPDADAPVCPRCGSPRSAAAPGGLCPRCLLGNVLRDGTDVSYSFVTEAPGRVLETLAATVGPIPRVLLPDTAGGDDGSSPARPASPEMPPPGDRPARVQLLGEIARGGMGAVLKGRDPDLGRDLAVKVLLAEHSGRPELVRRFVEEAQIAGQLQHPGVVPVYELGCFGDTRPYFTMKLVKGRTLAQLLDDRLAPGAERPRFLGVFEQVAQTVAYAHARGVIHRDLKPSNVMVGSFGEVQVMDWGLAKVLPRGGAVHDAAAGRTEPATPVQETVIATPRSESDSDRSTAGSVLGTPSYMAPEQARGEIDVVDERADVFALGSILCEILTGRPAMVGRTSGEIQRKAARGELADAFARLDGCGADPELVTLAKDCLAPERNDRPRDGGAVSGRLAGYLAGVQERLRAAELARAAESARAVEAERTAEAAEARARAERRARRMTAALAASLLLLIVAGGGAAAWLAEQRQVRRAEVVGLLDRAAAALDRAGREAAPAAAGASAEAREALIQAERLAGAWLEATLAARLRAIRDRVASETRLGTLLADLEAARLGRWDAGVETADAAYAAAFHRAGLEPDRGGPQGVVAWVAGRPVAVELAAYLDDWAFVRRGPKRPEDDWRRLIAAARATDPDPWRDALRARVRRKDAESVAAVRTLADDEPALDAQPAVSLILLAKYLKVNAGDRERAAGVLRRACRRHPGDFWVHVELAQVFSASSGNPRTLFPRPEESVLHYTAALALRPGSAWCRDRLGTALMAQGKPEEAEAEFRAAIRLQPDLAKLHHNLALVLNGRGKRVEAEAEYRAAIRLEPDLALSHTNLAKLLADQGKFTEAMAEHRESVRLEPDPALDHSHLGALLLAQGKTEEAEAEFRAAIRLKPDFPDFLHNLGFALHRQGKHSEAEAEYRAAIRVEPDKAESHDNLGAVLSRAGKLVEAMAEHREAIRLQPDLAMAHNNLGAALATSGRTAEAEAEYRAALRLRPDLTLAFTNLVLLMKQSDRRADAEAECRAVIRILPECAEAHCELGHLLRMQGKYEEALGAFRTGHALGSKRPDWRRPSDQWIGQVERYIAHQDRLPAVLRGDDRPKDSAERQDLARMCLDTKRYAGAARLLAEELETNPALTEIARVQHRYSAACAAARAGCGEGRDDPLPDDAARVRLRGQALAWLRANLAFRAGRLDTNSDAALRAMELWKRNPELAGVRDPAALAKLPAEECAAWRSFWAEVDALLAKARDRVPAPTAAPVSRSEPG